MNLPLNVNPSFDSPVIESQGFNSPDGCEINDSMSIALKTPMVKKPQCIFSPKKSLERVMDVLKVRIYPTRAFDPNQGHSDKPAAKKIRKS